MFISVLRLAEVADSVVFLRVVPSFSELSGL